MPAFFLVLYAQIALLGLFTTTAAEGYLATFRGLMGVFGLLMTYGVVKRHYDANEAH